MCCVSCASSLRGGCSTGANLSIEVTNVNARAADCKAATPGRSGPGSNLPVNFPGCRRREPWRPRRYPSLRAKRCPTPLLRVAKRLILQPLAQRSSRGPAVGQMRSWEIRRIAGCHPAKGLQNESYEALARAKPKRSSGGLLSSHAGISRSELSSIQYGGSYGGSKPGRGQGRRWHQLGAPRCRRTHKPVATSCRRKAADGMAGASSSPD
jgi:hypothetical protein